MPIAIRESDSAGLTGPEFHLHNAAFSHALGVLENGHMAMSASVDLPAQGGKILTLSGAWARERKPERRPIAPGTTSVYSGNFEAVANTDTFGVTRVRIGIAQGNFSWLLEPAEAFATPEAMLVRLFEL